MSARRNVAYSVVSPKFTIMPHSQRVLIFLSCTESKDIGSIQYAAMAKSSDKLVTGDDYLYLVIDLK